MDQGVPPPPPTEGPGSDRSTFVEQNRSALIIGGAIVIAAVVMGLILKGGSGGGATDADEPVDKEAASSTSYSIEGEFTIEGDYNSIYYESLSGKVGDACEGDGGYSDISPGVGVSVRNRQGDTIGSSTLEEGTVTDKFGDTFVCTLTFTVDDLPDSDLYVVEVAGRGEIGYTKAELEESDWEISLSL